MTPLPMKPTVIVRINPETKQVVDVASNIVRINDSDDPLTVKVVTTATGYAEAVQGLPFDSTRN